MEKEKEIVEKLLEKYSEPPELMMALQQEFGFMLEKISRESLINLVGYIDKKILGDSPIDEEEATELLKTSRRKTQQPKLFTKKFILELQRQMEKFSVLKYLMANGKSFHDAVLEMAAFCGIEPEYFEKV